MTLHELIAKLQEAETALGPDALVYGGGVQSGDRGLVDGVWILGPDEIRHRSWENARRRAGYGAPTDDMRGWVELTVND